jgi:flagellar biosynthetic protein FliS
MDRPSYRRNDYLESKVLTATGPRLHLMLVERALTCTNQAQQSLATHDAAAASQTLQRTIDIVAELLAGVRHAATPINKQLTAIYQFVLRTVTQAYFDHDSQKVTEAQRVLEAERTTWQQVCEKLAADVTPSPIAAHLAPADFTPAAGISFQV